VKGALRVAIAAIVAAASATILYPIYLSLLAGTSKVFEPHPFDLTLVALGTFAVTIGAQVVAWRAATGLALLALLVGFGLLFGVFAIFSIGLLVLPVALVLLVVLARAIRRRPLAIARPAALGGATVGYGLVFLFLALIIPPTVECFANGGGSTSSQRCAKVSRPQPSPPDISALASPLTQRMKSG